METDSRARLIAAFSGSVWHHDVSRVIVESGRHFELTARQRSRRYPTRLLRYFVPFHWIAREAVRRGRPLRVCEIGIGCGSMHRFLSYGLDVLGIDRSDVVERWVGIDIKLLYDQLGELPYDELVQADLEQDLDKIPAACDAYILLHVLEHLYEPEAAIRQLCSRLPGEALVIAGFPSHPHVIAALRGRYLRKHTTSNGHVSAMSNRRFYRAARAGGCKIEQARAAFFFRASGLFLEDYLWWQNFNLAWGLLFPSWPTESFIAARKQVVPEGAATRRAG